MLFNCQNWFTYELGLSLDMDESMKLNANGFHNHAWFVINIGYPYHKISFCTSLFQPRTSLYVFINDLKVFIACCMISTF